MTGESNIIRQLRVVASRLSSDVEFQKDLLQEMMIHLIQAQTEFPNHTLSWYVKNCEFYARNHMRRGRSIDSLKRAHADIERQQPAGDGQEDPAAVRELSDVADGFGELVSADIVQRIMPYLTERQQHTLQLLTKGFGVRETARQLGISHVAVIKHRRKIARIARELLGDTTVDHGETIAPSVVPIPTTPKPSNLSAHVPQVLSHGVTV